MIAIETWLLLLGFAVPVVISPGPGNTVLAAAGAKFGLRGTFPFWLGFELANLFWCLVYGLGLSELVRQHPLLSEIMKWAGTAYILYLAYGFLQPAQPSDGKQARPLTVADGIVSVSLNLKIHSMILVMFSQFMNPAMPLFDQVLQISSVFMLVCVACHFPWIYAGQLIFSRIRTARAMRLQGYLFAACMVLVALFVAFS
ncbi:threonine/homoserine/homoserine lactone efflux protein [Collimonas sp. PA-H2]|uniref:LysE family translocator n=1 Tax=Collimonas sp. PA-H2 TaxID=1881062 RepID=UPI000BF84F7B|nr:LysE family translocator [Collimonas sp. PA-H2]PFH11256.1 threonine/homoserine/homoserine lactone efflux protein [Collimonas sp. PA-H2]